MNMECHQGNIILDVPSDASFLLKERCNAHMILLGRSLTIPYTPVFQNPTVDDMKSSLA